MNLDMFYEHIKNLSSLPNQNNPPNQSYYSHMNSGTLVNNPSTPTSQNPVGFTKRIFDFLIFR